MTVFLSKILGIRWIFWKIEHIMIQKIGLKKTPFGKNIFHVMQADLWISQTSECTQQFSKSANI